MPPVIDKQKCTLCGLCDNNCPLDVIFLDASSNEVIILYPEECWHCGACRQDCPEGAVRIIFPSEMLSRRNN